MTSIEKWNKIVEYFEIHKNAPEQRIQNVWEGIFSEILGYSKLEGEIERQRNIQIGSTERVISDIIIKCKEKDLFIIELKRHNMLYSKGMERQILSYQKQLCINVGIIVCNKIYVYYYKGNNEHDRFYIDFVKDNTDGSKFVDMFSKNCFSESMVKDFVDQKNEFTQKTEQIKKEINPELITDLLRIHFISKYGEQEFEYVIKDFTFGINQRKSFIPLAVEKQGVPELRSIDTEVQYLFDLLSEFIRTLDSSIVEKQRKKDYIFYEVCTVHMSRKHLLVYIHISPNLLDPSEIDDSFIKTYLPRDYGCISVTIRNIDDLERSKPFLEKAYENNSSGKSEVYEPQISFEGETINYIDEKCIIIKINQASIDRNNGDIYDTTRQHWKISIDRAREADYVISVRSGIILEVYTDMQWEACNDGYNRIFFTGRVADDFIRSKYIDKRIPHKYMQKVMPAHANM